MSALTLSAKLDRTDSGTTWGFRLHGGKDFGCALTIQRVTPGSLAHKCGLQVGDTIAKIGGTPTDSLRHKEAQSMIIGAGNSLELALVRAASQGLGRSRGRGGGGHAAAPAPQQHQQQYSAPPPAAAPYQPPPAPFSPSSQNYNTAPRPFQGQSSGTVPVAVNSQYNTPLNMYSVGNVMDSLSGQTRNLGISGSEDGSSTGTSTPPPPSGGSMNMHDLNHNNTSTVVTQSPHVGFGSSSSSNTNSRGSTAPLPPWKVGVASEKRPSPVASPTRFLEQKRSSPVPPWKAPSSDYQIGSPAKYQTDDDKFGYNSPHVQSKTFKFLQTQLDSGQDPDVSTTVHTQYNSPMGLYNSNNVRVAHQEKSTAGLASDAASRPGQGAKLYQPSETFALVQQEDSLREPLGEDVHRPAPVRSFAPGSHSTTTFTNNTLSSQPGGGAPAAASPAAPAPRPVHAPAPAPAPAPTPSRPAPSAGTWKPNVPTGPRKMRLGRVGDAKSMGAPTAGGRIPICTQCGIAIRGPFVLALDKEWCPDHFNCSNPNCKVPLIDIGFVEEEGQVFCEKDYEQYFAPTCNKCNKAIVGECVNALRNTYHPHCFLCVHCRAPIGSGSFHMEDGNAYCEKDWQAMFQTKCYGCQFPIEPGDRWVEALSQNWHSECFNCSTCQVNLEGQPFFAKSGRPYCKKHAMAGGGRF